MKVKVLVTQLCLTLWPQGLWPRGSSVHGILQARRLEWVAFPSPGDLPNPGIKPRSHALQADSLKSEPPINYAVLCAMLSCSVMSDSLRPHGLYSSPGSSVHGDSPGKNTSVGCHALFQEIFPTQGSNPGLPHCRQILYCLSHQGSFCFHATLNTSHTLLPLLCPQVCSLCLHLLCCPANRFISTIFLDSIYMH